MENDGQRCSAESESESRRHSEIGFHLVCQENEPKKSDMVQLLPDDSDDDENPLGAVFSLRKPRDVFAGTSSGLKTCTKGVLIGVGSLVAHPIVFTKEKGVRGFFLGVAAGVLTCVASTAGGVCIGATQIVRGTLNTPSAIYHKLSGKKWGKESRTWETDYYNLKEEAEILKEPLEELPRKTAKASSSAGVIDSAYYETLDVRIDATADEIRKAYYKMSLKYHPDKNDSPEAAEKFRHISEVYQVLSDDNRRQLYDRHGREAATREMPKMDPSIFFNTIFGAFLFEPYVGTLHILTMFEGDAGLLDNRLDNQEAYKDMKQRGKLTKRRQLYREVELAVKLAERLDNGIEVGPEQFAKQMQEEARRLSSAANGCQMLQAIGWVYTHKAKQMSDANFAMKSIWKVQQKGHNIKTTTKAAKSIGQSLFSVRSILKKQEKKEKKKKKKEELNKEGDSKSSTDAAATEVKAGSVVRVFGLTTNTDLNDAVGYVREVKSNGRAVVVFSAETAPKAIKVSSLEVIANTDDSRQAGEEIMESLPLLMDTLWNVSVVDLQSTLHKVCYRVLKDMSISVEMRKKRNAAMLCVGQIFSQVAKENGNKVVSKEDKRQEFEFALRMMQAGATNDDVEHARQNKEASSYSPPPRTPKKPTTVS